MKEYRIAVNSDSPFGRSIVTFNFVKNNLEKKNYLNDVLEDELHTRHVGIYFIKNEEIGKETTNPLWTLKYNETFGFDSKTAYYLSRSVDMLDVVEMSSIGFIARVVALEDILRIFARDEDKPVEKPSVDHDGSYLEDGEYYVYHECKRCHRKIFIKLNDDCGYEYPSGWARHYGPEIEGNLCPSCEEKLSEMKKDLCVRFMEGEKL